MIRIRKTVPDEAPVLAEIQRTAFLPLYARYRDPGNPCLRGPEDISARLPLDSYRYFTITDDDAIVGGILYKCSGRTVFSEIPPGTYYLARLYIRPDRQGQGIGRQAILLCEKEFPDARRFLVDFPADLEKNRRCYEAAGFRDTGVRTETDPGVILAMMEKQLPPCERPQAVL